MYISAKEHARLRYRSRAIDRLVEAHATTPHEGRFLIAVDRILEPFRAEHEKRHAHKETPCPPKNT